MITSSNMCLFTVWFTDVLFCSFDLLLFVPTSIYGLHIFLCSCRVHILKPADVLFSVHIDVYSSSHLQHLGCRTDGFFSFFHVFFPLLLQKLQTDREGVFYFCRWAKIYNISSGSVSASLNKCLIPFLVWCFLVKASEFLCLSFFASCRTLWTDSVPQTQTTVFEIGEAHRGILISFHIICHLLECVASPPKSSYLFTFSLYCRLFLHLDVSALLRTSSEKCNQLQPFYS